MQNAVKKPAQMKLTQANLPALGAQMPVPSYDRAAVIPGILHLSVGGFHRSHQAVYLDQLFAKDASQNAWGIFGVSAMPNDKALASNLKSQDYLYTLLTMSEKGVKPQVIGSIVDGCFGPDNRQAIVDKIADKAIKIVSLTITEWGYYHDPITGDLNTNHADVKRDLENPDR